uniref:Reverse transcriptase domain-containing protein n=1 Tax=Tanacetum cinerariifolium TaxID=118510 RepID=A0A6L2P367_TANCI|nr:reverse transcriptase domain-containing protein [Tanacetum cinerariifolium]
MSAMANRTPIVTTVTKPATNPRDADATLRVNIQDFCEEYYKNILPIIMDKVRRDKQKEVHARLDFGEGSRERRTREDSHHSSVRARTTKPERLKVRDRLRYDDRHVLDRLGHRRQSAFDRLSETYSPNTTKSRPGRTNSSDHPRGRGHPRRLDTSNEDCPEDKECFCGVGESYDDSYSYSYHDGNRSCHMKRRRDNESPLSSVWKSDSSDGRTRMPNNMETYDGTGDPEDYVKIFQVAVQVERWTMPTRCHMFYSTLIGAARVWFAEIHPERVNSYKDLKAALLAYSMKQKKYVKDPVETHNIKQKDGETIEDFMERFKVETGRMNGGPEYMRISRFMHGVNNPELTKRLNEHVPKTMEKTMITTTTFIRGEAAATSKKKGHTSWRAQDQSKRQTSEKMSDFRGHPREKRGSNRFTPLQNRQKRFLRPRRVAIGDADHSTIAWINFMIVRLLSPYNGITGRPGIREIHAVPSTAHRMLKFTVEGGIITIRSTILIPALCTTVITSSAVHKEVGTRPENFKVALHPDFPDQEVAIGGTLSAKGRTELYSILKKNLDILACWRMCIDFMDLNKACYHQIQLSEPDEERTAFHTGQGVYCYTKMPFGLKNADTKYQRLVDKDFDSQIGRNIEVYVDDLVFKSHTEAEMLRDIDETFRTLRKINMKLNPKKCTFRAAEGVFLRYVVTPEGIKPCPDKTTDVLQLPFPRIIKEVQSLNGKLASLNRFLSKSAEKSLPLFKTLKKCIKKSDFHWTTEAEQSFK